MKYTYPDRVVVQFSDHSTEGTIIDSRTNTRWKLETRQHVPYETVCLVNFGNDCACWYPEAQLSPVDAAVAKL